MAVSYPHQYEIKLYKQHQSWMHVKLTQSVTGYHSDEFKPDSMDWNSFQNELIVQEYRGPTTTIGLYIQEFHVLSTHSRPFQHIRMIKPVQDVSGFCTLPTPGFNRLLFCISRGGVVAVDSAGDLYWSVPRLRARGICADQHGYLYVMCQSMDPSRATDPAMYILWHDGMILQTVTSGELEIKYGSPSRVHWDQARGHLVAMVSKQTLTTIKVTHLPGSY